MPKHFDTLKHNVWLPYEFAVGPVFNRFYEGLKECKILGNTCPQCGKILVPARTFCPQCNVDMNDWVEVSHHGQIVARTLANYEFYGMPVEPPFIGALIRLEGTDCDFLHLIGGLDLDDPEEVGRRVMRGTRVVAVWNDERKGHMLDIKHFKPE